MARRHGVAAFDLGDRIRCRRKRRAIDRDHAAARRAIAAAPVAPGDTLAILYTSGTTGPSKGVMCPHAQYYWWGFHSGRILGVTARTTCLHHAAAVPRQCAEYVRASLCAGAAQRMVLESRFSASGFWPAMIRNEATVIYLLGAMVPILLAREHAAEERAHKVRIGLGPGVPADLGAGIRSAHRRDAARRLRLDRNQFRHRRVARRPRSRARWAVSSKVSRRASSMPRTSSAAGEAGELVLRADEPFAFATGYFGMPDKTVEAWRNLWFHTGDRVHPRRGRVFATSETAISASSTGSRMRSAGAARTSRPMRSNRCCSPPRHRDGGGLSGALGTCRGRSHGRDRHRAGNGDRPRSS